MTHAELVDRAARWLKNTIHCRVILTELTTAAGIIPDVIGWVNGWSILIECKVSRSDFLRDLKKRNNFRRYNNLGNWRFYFAPPDIIASIELPEKWGLYEMRYTKIEYAGGIAYNNCAAPLGSDINKERLMLLSALARKG